MTATISSSIATPRLLLRASDPALAQAAADFYGRNRAAHGRWNPPLPESMFSLEGQRERLAETLLMLKEFFGFESDGVTLKGTVSRLDLANMIGTSSETVIRFLSEFKEKGIIGLDQKKIRILNSSALLRITHVFD